ncbi:hypothetical protein PUNSTDRAFT_134083 [Punctularia strigosozonata HHB-11173 SS5]|uniref:uncharacterized protein n=1 Tax=Punctularia strigosozonata (strain HHB-11173) TaxID=741275 RepID=UPI00044172DE|nr:uncharacterized protein PUNSTDRAFT_134083 [Punctularia strigosozonata HHB-11173 SS5]EIN08909.1 hypothetical protein PUNSTDRAFT_134083 [Punctularia strigosozonata HHB-11173 SS5]
MDDYDPPDYVTETGHGVESEAAFYEFLQDLALGREETRPWDDAYARAHVAAYEACMPPYSAGQQFDPEVVGLAAAWNALAGRDEPPWRRVAVNRDTLLSLVAREAYVLSVTHGRDSDEEDPIQESLRVAAASTHSFLLWHRSIRKPDITRHALPMTGSRQGFELRLRMAVNIEEYMMSVVHSIENEPRTEAMVPAWKHCYSALVRQATWCRDHPDEYLSPEAIGKLNVWHALVSDIAPLWQVLDDLNPEGLSWTYERTLSTIIADIGREATNDFALCSHDGPDAPQRLQTMLSTVVLGVYSYLQWASKVRPTQTTE